MSEDKPPRAKLGEPDAPDPPDADDAPDTPDADDAPDAGDAPDEPDDDVLRRAAGEIRASKSLEAFVPLSASERDQLAHAAIERVLGAAAPPSSARDASSPGSSPASPSSPASSPAGPSSPASSVPLRPRFKARAVAVVASMLALAAAVALYVGSRRSIAPLVAYAMAVDGEQHARGAGTAAVGERVTLRPRTRLVVTLTAAAPERDALLRLVLVRNGLATLLDPPVTRRAGGLVIEGPAAELLGTQTDGPGELVVVLGRQLPGDDEVRALALGAEDAPPHLQVLRQPVMLAGFSHAVEVLLGGCSAVLTGRGAVAGRPTCEVAAAAQLQLWVGVPITAAVAIRIDGAPVAAQPVARGGGSAFALEAPSRAVLSVRIDEREIAAWQLAPVATFDSVRAADAALAARRIDDAVAALDGMSAAASPEERLEGLRRRATIAFSRGEVGEERMRREQAVALARSLGRTSVEVDQTVAILYGLRNHHALAQAVQLLPALDAHAAIYAEGAVRRDWVHGLFASELGDLGAALAAFQRGLAVADRIADAADRAAIIAPLADVLQSLGRDGEVRALVDAELQRAERTASPCARVEALTSAGWLLRDRDRGQGQQLVDRAVELAVEGCERRVPIALVNQGWLLAANRRFGAARGVLDRLETVERARDARVTTWALRLEAEVLLGEDPAKAEQHAQHLAARAAALCSSELAYEAHLLRARALVLLDRPDPAVAAFVEAERALTLWSSLVPLGEGRNTFFERHDQLALTAIPFFVERARRGKPGARLALATTVRHSIARFVASLAGAGRERARAERGETGRDLTSKQFERTVDRWASAGTQGIAVTGVCEAREAVRGEPAPGSPATEALVAPPANAALFVHPAPEALLVLAWRGSSIDVREITRAGVAERPDELAARIASVAAPLLDGAPRVRLYLHRTLAGVPLDRSLAALLDVPVAFAVDAAARPAGASCRDRRALLVTNPQRNLWAASDAAHAIEADLARMGFRVDTLDGAAATRAAVVARLADPCTALFHYDGHGATGAGGVGDRVDDALLLAGGEVLTAGDVLGLPRVPDQVVLNGCTTAAPEGLGLAQAFLLAGAAQVVASLDEVPADAAARFTRELFAAAPGEPDLVALFARAVAGADVPALRVFER